MIIFNCLRPDMQFFNSYGKLCILDVTFSIDGNDINGRLTPIRKPKLLAWWGKILTSDPTSTSQQITGSVT
jgi:hypothetical protein